LPGLRPPLESRVLPLSECRRLLDRVETRKNEFGRGRTVDKGARRWALKGQWDPAIDAFRCHYTGVALATTYGSRRYTTWEHRAAGDESSVVLVADLVNKMKSGDSTEHEFIAMVRALSRHFDGEPFDEFAFPSQAQGRMAPSAVPPPDDSATATSGPGQA
jgi:hypothetical protein